MASYPIEVAVDYQEHQSRLTTFFRALMAIPHMIWLTIYGIAAYVAIIVAWFAILFTGRYPEGLYTFNANYLRLLTQFTAYFYVITDKFPPFEGTSMDYPVRVGFDGPLPEYSRVKVFFRGLLALPLMLLRYYVVGPLLLLGAIAAWVVIVITGKMPKGLHDLMALGLVYSTRSDGYFPFLHTETYPPFVDEGPSTGVVSGAPSAGSLGGGAPAVATADPLTPIGDTAPPAGGSPESPGNP